MENYSGILGCKSNVSEVVKQEDGAVKMVYGIHAFKWSGTDEVLLQLCKTLVRPHLKICMQFWFPYCTNDLEALERVKKRFTSMLPELDF